ncbi:hypothetical protein [Luteolibacter marinus]|uniref:hypothetical protein n=1 Tax=Luteolibacter marinus TaxID=2776705 RepID=UPI00186962AA|nr:hypothetical protein [Luteolibacter marinus]
MRKRHVLGPVLAGLVVPVCHADFLDDLDLSAERFARNVAPVSGSPFGLRGQVLLGVPISEEHEQEIAEAMHRGDRRALISFLESRGDYAAALALGPIDSLDRIRLMLRSRQPEEARAVKGELSSNSFQQACRPLEDAGEWDLLAEFFGILAEREDSPDWRRALWSEELDVAWHRDQLGELLNRTKADPLKLAFFLHRLGDQDEVDHLVEGLLEDAGPAELAEILALLRDNPRVVAAGVACWHRGDLELAERRGLIVPLMRMPDPDAFAKTLGTWLANGGDPEPLVDLIWQEWRDRRNQGPTGIAVLGELQRRLPDDPHIKLLLAKELRKSDPVRSADLFEQVAVLPLKAVEKAEPGKWLQDDLRGLDDAAGGDLAYLAIRGLGLLDRQDRVRAVLERHGEWADLPVVDRVRYLAAGGMDFEMVATATDAALAEPGNAGVSGWLLAGLALRLVDRVLPPEVANVLVGKFDQLAAGDPGKSGFQVRRDAEILLRLLGGTEVDAGAWQSSLDRLATEVSARDSGQVETLQRNLRRAAGRFPRLQELIPDHPVKKEPADSGGELRRSMQAGEWLTAFAPPEILRIQPVQTGRFLNMPPAAIMRAGVPVQLLERWSETFARGGFGLPFGMAPKEDDRVTLQRTMRLFKPGDPRRLLVEILIARGMFDCGDAALKAQADASYAALMAGEKEARGTEAFRFAVLAGSGAKDGDVLQILAELKDRPVSVRSEFLRRIGSGLVHDRRLVELARRELKLEPPRMQATPDEDARILSDLQQRNLAGTPESIVAAKRILDKVALAKDGPNGGDSYQAARILQMTGQFDAWLQEIQGKMRRAGFAEVEILRVLQAIDRREPEEGESRAIANARRILALDPMDAVAASQLIRPAVAGGDRELMLACIRAMGEGAVGRLSQADVLGAFGKEDAVEVLTLVRELNPVLQMPDGQSVTALHRYFLSSDPGLAAEFRRWLAARSNGPVPARRELAGQLVDAGRRDDAVDLLVGTYVAAADYPGFPHTFPPKPGGEAARRGMALGVERLEPDLEFLLSRGLLGEVVTRLEAMDGAEHLAVVTFRMALSPDAANFESQALPVLADMGESSRGACVNQWVELFSEMPGAGHLVLRLLEERAAGLDRATEFWLADLIRKAAVYPDSSTQIGRFWARLSKAAADCEDPAEKARLESNMESILNPMLVSSDDPTWRDYWTWRERRSAPRRPARPMGSSPFSTDWVDPVRLGQVVSKWLAELDGGIPEQEAGSWAMAAVTNGEPALIDAVKAALPAGDRGAAELCDLGKGITTAVSPVVGAGAGGDGTTLVWWNLVGLPPVDKTAGIRDLPRCAFPSLDGKFKLQITAGTRSDRLESVMKIETVASAGHARLKLRADQQWVGLLFTEETTGAVRWIDPIDIRNGGGPPLPLTDGDLQALGFEKLQPGGPGGLPAWKVRFSGPERIDLLDRPWTGVEPVSVGAWVGGDGKLTLRCLDGTGRELQTLDLVAWESPLAAWQYRSVRMPDRAKIAPDTERLVLSASVHGNNDGPLDFMMSGVRVEIGPEPALPRGFERITRIPGVPEALAISPDEQRLAIGIRPGKLGLVETGSGKVEVIPIPSTGGEEAGRVLRLQWGPAGLHALLGNGVLYRFDEERAGFTRIMTLDAGMYHSDFSSFLVSPDEKWVAWRSKKERGLVLGATDGSLRRELETGNHGPRFEFIGDGLLLTANDGKRALLKTTGFPEGDPEPAEGFASFEAPRYPGWSGGVQFNRDPAHRDGDRVMLPVGNDLAVIASGGTIFYVDGTGNLIRVMP